MNDLLLVKKIYVIIQDFRKYHNTDNVDIFAVFVNECLDSSLCGAHQYYIGTQQIQMHTWNVNGKK